MAKVRGSSQAREEEPRDIQVIWEQLLPQKTVPLVIVVEQERVPDEDDEIETDEEDPVELPQSGDEEDEEEETPLNLIAARMYDKVYDRNVELQDTVEELQEVVAEQQTLMAQKGDEIQDREERLNNVEEKLIHTEGENERMIAEIAELKNKLTEESTKRARAEDAYNEAYQ